MSRNTLGRVGSEVGIVVVIADMEKAAVEISGACQSVGGIVEADIADMEPRTTEEFGLTATSYD